jgi:predicted DNA-binding protein
MAKKKAESWLSETLHKRFKNKAKRNGTTMARILREAVKGYVKRKRIGA